MSENYGNKLDAARQCDELTKGVNKLNAINLNATKRKVFPDFYSFSFPESVDITAGSIVERPMKSTQDLIDESRINLHSSQEEKEAPPVGLRFNKGKVRWDLIDPTAVEGVAAVLGFGAEKYSAENWRKGLSWKSTLRSLESHLQALKRGEDIDSESGLPHIDHLGCNWMFFSNYQKMGIGEDDRVKHGKTLQEKTDKMLLAREKAWLPQQLGIKE